MKSLLRFPPVKKYFTIDLKFAILQEDNLGDHEIVLRAVQNPFSQ